MKHKDQIIQLYNEGKSYSQIANELGCSKGTIAYHVGNGVKDKTLKRQRDSRSKRSKYIQNLKQESGCADCKENYPYYMLEFDHRFGETKLFCISRAPAVSEKMFLEELAKCDIVCANCHAMRTYMRLVGGSPAMPDLYRWYKSTT